jgi:hypothetical protein
VYLACILRFQTEEGDIMGCREIRELYSPWLDGELSPEEARLVQEHLDGCIACREELALWKKFSTAMRETTEEVAAPPEFTAGVMARIRELDEPMVSIDKKRSRRTRIPWKQWVAGVAAAALVAMGSIGLGVLPGKIPVPIAKHETPEPGPSVGVDLPGQVESPIGKSTTGDKNQPGETAPENVDPGQNEQVTPNTPAIPSQPGTERQPGVKIAGVPDKSVQEGRTFLNKDRKTTSTLMKVKVADLEAARSQAMQIGEQNGAKGRVVAQQAIEDKNCVILRFVIPSIKAGGFMDAVSGLGSVFNIQADSQDITGKFASTLEQYRGLIAQRQATQDSAQKSQLDRQIETLEKQLVAWDSEADQHIVVLWLQE